MKLVTGGAGFIGSHLVEALLNSGEQVRVVDNFSTGRIENLRGMTERIDLISGDLSDPDVAKAATRDVDTIYHEAALPSVPRSVRDPFSSHQSGATATLLLLQAAQEAGVERFIYAASSSAYGNTPTLPKVETMPTRPLSPYAVSKLAGEMYAQAFHHVHGMTTVCLRYFNIFGPRQDPDSAYAAVIPKFASDLLSGARPKIYGDGEQTRDFTFIENAVEANLLAASVDGIGGEVFNVACGKRISLNRLVELLQEETGAHLTPEYVEPRPGDVRDSLADIGKAKNMLGYNPKVSLEQGIARTVADLAGREGLRRAA